MLQYSGLLQPQPQALDFSYDRELHFTDLGN